MNTKKIYNRYANFLLIIAGLVFFPHFSAHKAAVNFFDANDEMEQRLANLMKDSKDQQRFSLTYNPILARVARQRAYDMGQRAYKEHTSPDGDGQNYVVAQSGYILPDYYGKKRDSNDIESIARGKATAQDAWNLLMQSKIHRDHLLGLDFRFTDQTEYGVGYAFAPDSLYQHYWVIITARPGESRKSPVANLSVP